MDWPSYHRNHTEKNNRSTTYLFYKIMPVSSKIFIRNNDNKKIFLDGKKMNKNMNIIFVVTVLKDLVQINSLIFRLTIS